MTISNDAIIANAKDRAEFAKKQQRDIKNRIKRYDPDSELYKTLSKRYEKLSVVIAQNNMIIDNVKK